MEIIYSQVGYGELGTSGKLGYEGKNVAIKGNYNVSTVSAHAPSFVAIKLTESQNVFAALNHDVGKRISSVDCFVDGERIGELEYANDVTKTIAITPGIHVFEFKTNNNDSAHSVWCFQRECKATLNKQKKLGIAVCAGGIDQETINRFLYYISKTGISVDIEINTDKCFPIYNRGRMMNRAVRKLIERNCDIIAQCDIDCAVSKDLLECAINMCEDGIAIHNPSTFCDLNKLENSSVEECYDKQNPTWHAKGVWNVMSKNDWLRMKGHVERLFGWGVDDIIFQDQIKGVADLRVMTMPLIHINHPGRDAIWGNAVCRNCDGEVEWLKSYPKIYNYLSDVICPQWNRNIGIFSNSFCPNHCKNCNQQYWRNMFPDYQTSKEDVDFIADCIKESGETFNRLLIYGGDPLYWKNLEYALEKLSALENVKEIRPITTIPDWDLFEKAAKKIKTFCVSNIGSNENYIDRAQKELGVNLDIWEARTHRVLPSKNDNFGCGECYCRDGIVFFQRRVFCCTAVLNTQILKHGCDNKVLMNPNYSEPLTNTFVDIMRGKSYGNEEYCGYCSNCSSVFHALGHEENIQ